MGKSYKVPKRTRTMKITILQGLPGSGKSTLACKMCKDNKMTLRVNKDIIREMLYLHEKDDNEGYRQDLEKTVKAVEDSIAELLMMRGYNIVVDDVNGSKKHIRRYKAMADKWDYDFEIVKLNTPLNVCIERDSKRHCSLGEKVIKQIADQTKFATLEDIK